MRIGNSDSSSTRERRFPGRPPAGRPMTSSTPSIDSCDSAGTIAGGLVDLAVTVGSVVPVDVGDGEEVSVEVSVGVLDGVSVGKCVSVVVGDAVGVVVTVGETVGVTVGVLVDEIVGVCVVVNGSRLNVQPPQIPQETPRPIDSKSHHLILSAGDQVSRHPYCSRGLSRYPTTVTKWSVELSPFVSTRNTMGRPLSISEVNKVHFNLLL